MNAFADALADLHADPDVSVACEWAPGWDRDWPRTLLMNLQTGEATLTVETQALRGVEAKPVEGGFGYQPGVIAGRRNIDLVRTDLPVDAMRGDLLMVGADSLTVETAEVDLEGLTWRLMLSVSA